MPGGMRTRTLYSLLCGPTSCHQLGLDAFKVSDQVAKTWENFRVCTPPAGSSDGALYLSLFGSRMV
jgi:hypothetical protein